MPFGEMTVTLEDVNRILGVRITGTCIYKKDGGWEISYDDVTRLAVDQLRIERDKVKAETNGTYGIRMHWIMES